MKWYSKMAPAALAFLALSGCGGTEEDRITLAPVSGTITRNNKPMAGASVAFLPEQGNAATTPGSDTTGPEGTYKIMFKNRSGLAPGKYKVTVTEAIAVADKAPPVFTNDPLMGHFAAAAKPKTADDSRKAAGVKNEFEAEVADKGGTFDFVVKGGTAAAAKK